ncbi:hypothetical protein [Niveibacterium terrae]|jgi:hypothetical protein|uniref:hypothetical protein n=1 Tax=Niveibacterium terrae TaxID=3373598 RepID=UPI003A904104
MAMLFVIFVFLCIAFAAPLKFTFGLILTGLIVSTAVKLCARTVSGIDPTHGQALRAVGLSLVFVLLAGLTMFSFAYGSPSIPSSIAALSAPVILLSPLIGYTLGFRIALGASLAHSALIALLSSALSIGVLYAMRTMVG